MADYKETPVAGTSWRRAKMVSISNPLGGIPTISFVEEDVIKMADGTTFTNGQPTFCDTHFDPQATFPLINPLTGEPTGGTMTQAELYAVVYSLYMDLAAKRDNPEPVLVQHPSGNPIPEPLVVVIPPSNDPAPGP